MSINVIFVSYLYSRVFLLLTTCFTEMSVPVTQINLEI